MSNSQDAHWLAVWRSVQGPKAELTGPLIRFAAKLLEEADTRHESDKNWLRAQRDIAEEKLQAKSPQHVEDALHDVFTRHGIASRSDYPYNLIGDLIRWAAAMCSQSIKETSTQKMKIMFEDGFRQGLSQGNCDPDIPININAAKEAWIAVEQKLSGKG